MFRWRFSPHFPKLRLKFCGHLWTSSSIVDIGTRHDLPSEKPVFQSHAVKSFDVANQGHYYIVNSLRTWEYPIGDPVQILNWFLAWKWGCVLLWPEVIFFSSARCASLTRLRREPSVSIRKKISSGTQGMLCLEFKSNLQFYFVEYWTSNTSMVAKVSFECNGHMYWDLSLWTKF